jgi:hypothetical protein
MRGQTFFIGCFFQFKSLSRSMSVVRSKSGTHSRETDRLTWAYRSLVFTSSMMMLITGIFIVLNRQYQPFLDLEG